MKFDRSGDAKRVSGVRFPGPVSLKVVFTRRRRIVFVAREVFQVRRRTTSQIFPVTGFTSPVLRWKNHMTREYIELTAAFGKCLNAQNALGARLVAALDVGLNAVEDGDRGAKSGEAESIRKQMREGRKTLTRLRNLIRKIPR